MPSFWYIGIFLVDFCYGTVQLNTTFEWNWDMTNVSFWETMVSKTHKFPVLISCFDFEFRFWVLISSLYFEFRVLISSFDFEFIFYFRKCVKIPLGPRRKKVPVPGNPKNIFELFCYILPWLALPLTMQ